MNTHHGFLTAAHAYPTSAYPGMTQPGPLEMLLRKKLEPASEDWVARYAKPRVQVGGQANGVSEDIEQDGSLGNEQMTELWAWAGQTNKEIVNEIYDAMEDDYTIAEREVGIENLRTGLKRKLGDDSDSEDEEDGDEEGGDEKMEDIVMPRKRTPTAEPGVDISLRAMQMETLLSFTSAGVSPPLR